MRTGHQREVDAVIADMHEIASELSGYAEELHGLREADGDDSGRVANLKAALKAVRDAMPKPAGD